MKLYALKCVQGYLRKTASGCLTVNLEKATVVAESGLLEMEAFAQVAKEEGFLDIRLVELTVTEGDIVKRF